MRYPMKKRAISFLLSVLLLLGMLPVGTQAEQVGSFVLVVESGGKLVIAPEYVSYTDGQTVREALTASGHTFTGLEDGWITEIDGTGGNFTRSDDKGSFDLNAPASEVKYYRFSEDTNSQPSEGLQKLMSAMADYRQKDADVKAAAKEAYDVAYDQFVGIDSASAALLAENLNEAVRVYEENQAGDTYTVTFTDGIIAHSAVEITVENPYGKVWTDDGDGVLELPSGDYAFCVTKDGLWVEGTITVSEDLTVHAALPEALWLNLNAFRLSGSYGAEDSEENRFSDDEYTVDQWDGRKTTVAVPDTFTGTIYTYARYQDLTELPRLTAIYTSAKDGKQTKQDIPFESLTSGAANVLKKGAAGNTVIYRVSSTGADGYCYSQDYTVEFGRVPTLTSIRVADQNGVDQAANMPFDGNRNAYAYKVVDTVTAVTVTAQPLDSSYGVTVNGENAVEGVTVELDGETTVEVVVSAGDYSNTYTLTVLPGAGRKLSFVTAREDVTLEVVNSNGEVMPFEKFREGTSGNRYQYVLVPGEAYSYVATAGTYYHLADEFTMEDVADSTIQVNVTVEDWLTALAFGSKSGSSSKDNLPLDTRFSSGDHSYDVQYVDTEHNVYAWVASNVENVKIRAIYRQNFASALYHGIEKAVSLTSEKKTGTQLNRFLMDENPIENAVTIRLEKEVDGILYYQDYQVQFKRTLTLEDISAACEGATITLIQENEEIGFDPHVKEYSVTVSMAADALDLSVTAHDGNPCYGESEVGYRVKVDGVDVTEDGVAQIALNGTLETQTAVVTVENEKAPEGSAEYTLHILKSPPVQTTFRVAPEKALLAVYETMSGQRLWADENGTFQFCEGYSYRYALTAYGYVSKFGTLTVTRDENKALVVLDGDQAYPVAETQAGGGTLTIQWELREAEQNSSLQSNLDAYWPNFRGNSTNNAVTDTVIPNGAEEGTLYWANQIGKGFDEDAVGSPIIVNDELITYAGDKIFRIDTVSGTVKKTGTMDHKSSFSITPPAYAEGMVFVALSDGTVQAFNAVTLEPLWIYRDTLGGQPNCPLTIHDGYLYTGFWNSETGDANFVCLSITDEDPTQQKEQKCASWYHTAKGGFYWAGAYACDDYVLIGTDDGTNSCTEPTSSMLAFVPRTGELLDRWDNLNGDIRSTVVYDSATDAYYFTSKGGSFYSLKMEQTDGGWKMGNRWSVELQNGTDGTPMSTCSPVVYNGRAYVGVSGAGQFAAYSGHNITVIDLAGKKIAYSVQTQGYPQTSGLLTTAYEEESGYVYVYFFDNMTPGKLRVLRDKAGQTGADYVTVEGSYKTAYALFTPTADQAQYAICSPIVDKSGTIYFKNDSAYLMAFGSAIDKIEVTRNPDKTVYADGAAFDPAGMIVTATYANGETRDVTDYVTWDVETVTEGNTTVTISFPYVMYHNEENGQAMSAGIASTTPVTTLAVAIGQEKEPGKPGDVNLDGQINTCDANLVVSFFYGNLELTQEQISAADVNGDGEVNIKDSNLIVSCFYGNILEF